MILNTNTPSLTGRRARTIQRRRALLEYHQSIAEQLNSTTSSVHSVWFRLWLRIQLSWAKCCLVIAGLPGRSALREARFQQQFNKIQEQFTKLQSVSSDERQHMITHRNWPQTLTDLVRFEVKREFLLWSGISLLFIVIPLPIVTTVNLVLHTTSEFNQVLVGYVGVNIASAFSLLFLTILMIACLWIITLTIFTPLFFLAQKTRRDRMIQFSDHEIQYSLLEVLSTLEQNPYTWNQGEIANKITNNLRHVADYLDYKSETIRKQTKLLNDKMSTHMFKAATRLHSLASSVHVANHETYGSLIKEISTDFKIAVYGHYGDLPTSEDTRQPWKHWLKDILRSAIQAVAPGTILLIIGIILHLLIPDFNLISSTLTIGVATIVTRLIKITDRDGDVYSTLMKAFFNK